MRITYDRKKNNKYLHMKNIKIITLTACIALMLSLMLFSSCSDDANTESASPPVIESVMPSGYAEDGSVVPLTPVIKGDPKSYYVIHGKGLLTTQKVYFNDFDTYFRPTFVTDTDIFILIDENTPFDKASNKLKVVTKFGTVFYDFAIVPPAPTIGSFNPINAVEGDIVTVYGNHFSKPVIKIGTVAVPVISFTMTELKFKLPAGVDKKYISITNISDTETSRTTNSADAIGTAIYDDVSYYGLGFPSWNGHTYETDGTAQQGLTYIKKEMDAWGSLQGDWAWYDQLAPYAGIRVSVKAKNAGALKFVFNGNWDDKTAPILNVTTEWRTFYIPWSALSTSDRVQNITFQNMSKDAHGDGVKNTFSIDNIGLFLK
jgi:hypothetical protein